MSVSKMPLVEEAYARVKGKNGELPTSAEVAEAAGVSPKYAREALRKLGLAYRRVSKRMLEKEAQARERQEEAERAARANAYGHRAVPAMSRILEILQSGDPAARPQKLRSPGEGYEITDRIMLTCPVCGAQKLIAPRMHPFWLRNRAGVAILVDKEACTGRMM